MTKPPRPSLERWSHFLFFTTLRHSTLVPQLQLPAVQTRSVFTNTRFPRGDVKAWTWSQAIIIAPSITSHLWDPGQGSNWFRLSFLICKLGMILGTLYNAYMSIKFSDSSKTLSEEAGWHILRNFFFLILLVLFNFLSGNDVFPFLMSQTCIAEFILTSFSGTLHHHLPLSLLYH